MSTDRFRTGDVVDDFRVLVGCHIDVDVDVATASTTGDARLSIAEDVSVE